MRFLSRLKELFGADVHRRRFYLHLFMTFALFMGDSIMSYSAPVAMDRVLGATRMGLIMSTSSMVGMIVDFLFAKTFVHQKAAFFKKIILIFLPLFPLSFLVVQNVLSFFFAMIVWGIYFEAIVFSNYHIIHECVPPQKHAWAWALLSTSRNLTLALGPLLAAYLDRFDHRYSFIAALGFVAIGLSQFIIQQLFSRRSRSLTADHAKVEHRDIRQEVQIWKSYARVIWPLLIFMFLFTLIDATFFSIGPVFGVQLAEHSPLGELFISMYTIPALIFGITVDHVSRPLGKKRTAFVSGIVGGMGLLLMSQMERTSSILLATFLAAIGLAILYPAVVAVFEDYVARSNSTGNDLIGLTAIMVSMGYVISPMLNGFLADQIGLQTVFGLWGLLLLIFSVFAIFAVKRKLKMPHKEIEEVLYQRLRR